MIPSETFRAIFTVPNALQRLTATRPVQVYTYDFNPERDTLRNQPPSLSDTCGELFSFPGDNELPPHDHEHHEIAIVVAGTAVHRTAAYANVLRSGSALTVAPGEVHAFERIDGLRMINCTYLTEWLFYDLRDLLSVDGLAPLFFPRTLCGAGRRLRVPQWVVDPETLRSCMRELRDIAGERDREDPSSMLLKRTLEKLMLILHRAYVSSGEPTLVALRPRIRTALERIEERVRQCKPLDVGTLAREACMSRDGFSRTFKQAIGWSPTDYFQYRRVQQACCMLLDADQTITEVAYALGYFDASHFSHLFKRYRDMSPQQFRRKYAEE